MRTKFNLNVAEEKDCAVRNDLDDGGSHSQSCD